MKIEKCRKCNSEFEMPDNFAGKILCEQCDPAMSKAVKRKCPKEKCKWYFYLDDMYKHCNKCERLHETCNGLNKDYYKPEKKGGKG